MTLMYSTGFLMQEDPELCRDYGSFPPYAQLRLVPHLQNAYFCADIWIIASP